MKYLITSALPYINGDKHLGNLIGSMLPADVHARYLRLVGHDVLFVCATDEHGTPAELAALAQGKSVEEYCEQVHAEQHATYRRLGLSFDFFSRTSGASNHHLTQMIYRQLKDAGFIEKKLVTQLFSKTDGRFLPDRYVLGTCPHCGYTAARGDQCESCTRLLEPVELIAPRSAISGSTDLELRQTAHLYLRLTALTPDITHWVETSLRGPTLVQSIARKWLAEGLLDRCITRDLQWGVKVPELGMEGKVFYVWFDAPIGYVASSQDWAEASGDPHAWESWWKDAQDVTYVQYMAKDNVPFHTIMFPGMLLGTRKPWKLPDYVKGFNWLNYYGGKFSTSSKRGVFLQDALALFASDYWRYTLLASAPESADSTFTWAEFATRVNKDLNDKLGNFVNRVLRLSISKFGLEVPAGGAAGEAERQLALSCVSLVQQLRTHLDAMEFRKATETLRDLWTAGNVYVDQTAPWKALKEDAGRGALILRVCINLAALYAVLIEPFLPDTAASLRTTLQLPEDCARTVWHEPAFDLLPAGHRILAVEAPLFRKIADDEVAALESRFGGA